MAYLYPPLTIIDNQSTLHPSILPVTPAATWFDEDRQHFVALKRAPSQGDSSELAREFYSRVDDEYSSVAEIVYYQAFRLPDDRNLEKESDAAEKAVSGTDTLVTELSAAFPLPRELSTSSMETEQSHSRRVPLLAKFSESVDGVRFLALQYTPTMVRIVNIQNPESSSDEYSKHWTVDLSCDINPVPCAPHHLPSFSEGKELNTTIIGGGVIWCCGTNNSLNLILITTTAVIIYEMNLLTRNLRQSRIYPHQTATSFWFEATSRVLVIGSYKSNYVDNNRFPDIVMDMKTLFFTDDGSIEILPAFVVGSLRERDIESINAADDQSTNIVMPNDLSLVCLHGDVFFVELGSLGSRKGIGLIKLDRTNKCIHVRQHETMMLMGEASSAEVPFVAVVDNLLCIIKRESKSTLVLDAPAIFSNDPYTFKFAGEIKNLSPEDDVGIYDRSLSFLAPSFFLHTDGEGLLYEIKLDINAFLQFIPLDACIVPFLLKRCMLRETILTIITERFDALVRQRDLSTLKVWLRVIVEEYSKSEASITWDLESTDMLLLRACSLLAVDKISLSSEVSVSGSCENVLVQSEILQLILLKHVKLAYEEADRAYLELVCSMSVQYLIEIEKRSLQPCFALQCLIVALLVKHRSSSELSSYLNARETQWTQIKRKGQLNWSTQKEKCFDPSEVALKYSEILFKIAVSCACASKQERLILHATSIFIQCNDNAAAVKYLLSASRLEDAITVTQRETFRCDNIIRASDFFNATTKKAMQESTADKFKIFYHLYFFIQQSFPDAFQMVSKKVKVSDSPLNGPRTYPIGNVDTVTIEQSKLAHECDFPDDLFGGRNNVLCQKLRVMFGYYSSAK